MATRAGGTGVGQEDGLERRRRTKSELVRFYLFAFGISWCGYLPLFADLHGVTFFHSRLWLTALVLPGVGPAVAAAFAPSGSQQRGLADALVRLRRSFLRPVPLRWWVLVVLVGAGIMFVASILTHARSDPHASLLRQVSGRGFLAYLLVSLMANPLEEIGWRGFAQTRLEELHTPLTAACIVGFFWTIWHVPLFVLSGIPVAMSEISFPAWAAGVIPQAILLAWVYGRTGRSLAAVSVFHLLGNLAGGLFDSSQAIVSIVRIAVAMVIVALSGPSLGICRLGERLFGDKRWI